MRKLTKNIGKSFIISLIALAMLIAPVISAQARPVKKLCSINKSTCCCCSPSQNVAENSSDRPNGIKSTCGCNMDKDKNTDKPIAETQITYDNRENQVAVAESPANNSIVIYSEKENFVKPLRADYSSPPLFIINTSFLI